MINSNIMKFKGNKQLNLRNKSISLTTTNHKKLIYKIIKAQKLGEIKTKTRRISQIMDSIGGTFKIKNKNQKKVESDLMNQNLTKINFRRSLLVQKKLKDLDKLNTEFDKEFINEKFFFYDNNEINRNNNYDSFSDEEGDYDKYITSQNSININLNFDSEQRRIFSILYRKNKKNENRPFSDYIKNKKLYDLKSNIEYVCGIKLDEENSNNKDEIFKDELDKNTHYIIPKRKPRFIRDKNKNESFTPCIRYDKSKIFFEKNYDLSKSKENKRENFKNKDLRYYFGKNIRKKMFLKKNDITPIKNKGKIINIEKEKNKLEETEKLTDIKNEEYQENAFKSLTISNTFSKIKYKNFFHNNKRKNSKRCIKNLKTENNNSNRKKISSILKNLLKETCLLNNELKIGINIISSNFNDYKVKPKKNNQNLDLDLEKIRKDLNLNQVKTIIKDSDIIIKNEKKMEKKIRKEDVHILRKVVNNILQEDRLANKNIIYNNNSLSSKLKKIMERKIKNRKVVEPDEPGEEKKQMIKLFTNDSPDFFNLNHLTNLIKRYKTMKIK